MIWTRRRLLLGALTSGIMTRSTVAATATDTSVKHVTLRSVHTGEKVSLDFKRGGAYLSDSLARISLLLRDHRSGEQHAIDPKLVDCLYDAAGNLGNEPTFDVISGYRSPQTNALLRAKSDGVSSHSLHMEGRAIDVRLVGVESAKLARCAVAMHRGGVGYYKNSDFVHLDTGHFRTWRG